MARHAVIAEFKCPECGARFRACATASNDWIIKCPEGHGFMAEAGTRADAPRSNLLDNRVFTGQETLSRSFGFHPAEVNEVREMLGPVGNCINADGDVNFGSRAEERAFRTAYKAVRASNEGRAREGEQRQDESGDGE